MHKIKFYNKAIILLIISILTLNSCNKSEIRNEEGLNSIDYSDFNQKLKSYTKSIPEIFNSEESVKEYFDQSFRIKTKNKALSKISFNNKNIDGQTIEQVYVELPSHYTDFNNDLILEYYNDMANAYDYEIPDVINIYQNKLDNTLLLISNEEKEQFQIILNASKYAVEALESAYNGGGNILSKNNYSSKGGGFWDCMRKTAGKKIGRGMVYGAITGAINGAIVGGTGGTVAFPGVGTVTGAVGGAVFGGAAGAVKGAVGGAIWAAADCLSAQVLIEKYELVLDHIIEDKILTIDTELIVIPNNTIIQILPI